MRRRLRAKAWCLIEERRGVRLLSRAGRVLARRPQLIRALRAKQALRPMAVSGLRDGS
jgi:hypothetical protein